MRHDPAFSGATPNSWTDGQHVRRGKPKGGFKSSYFYRTNIRGSKWNGLIFTVSVALATLCIYTSRTGENDGEVEGFGKGDGADQVMFENVNPKFDGLNRRVELDGDDGRGDDVGLNDEQKRGDRVNIKNSDSNEHDDEDRFNPQGRGGGSKQSPEKRGPSSSQAAKGAYRKE